LTINNKTPKRINFNTLITLFSVLLILTIWFLASIEAKNPILVPSPIHVFYNFLSLLTKESFWISILYTFTRALIGFSISLILGLIIGILAGRNSHIHAFFLPYLIIMRSTPVISFILLILIWFTSGNVAVFIAFLVMFPLLCTTIIEGMHNIDKRLIEMSQVYAFSNKQRILHIYIPGITPFLLAGTTNALGMGWRAIIIGEVLSQPLRGIGTNLHQAHTFLQVSELISWTIAAILIGYLFEIVLRIIEQKLTPWKDRCHD
jgi:NitT/TauT family transport system permease protein